MPHKLEEHHLHTLIYYIMSRQNTINFLGRKHNNYSVKSIDKIKRELFNICYGMSCDRRYLCNIVNKIINNINPIYGSYDDWDKWKHIYFEIFEEDRPHKKECDFLNDLQLLLL